MALNPDDFGFGFADRMPSSTDAKYGRDLTKFVWFPGKGGGESVYDKPQTTREEISIQPDKKLSSTEVQKLREDLKATKKEMGYLAAAEGVAEMSQAILSYRQFSENAERNIRLMQDDIDRLGENAENIRRAGKAGGFQEQLKGRQRADDSKLKLAAQGQKVSGQGVKRVSRSHMIAAATRAAQVENASMERALGLEQEQVSLKVQQADVQRKKAYARLQSNVKAFGGLVNAGLGVYSGL